MESLSEHESGESIWSSDDLNIDASDTNQSGRNPQPEAKVCSVSWALRNYNENHWVYWKSKQGLATFANSCQVAACASTIRQQVGRQHITLLDKCKNVGFLFINMYLGIYILIGLIRKHD